MPLSNKGYSVIGYLTGKFLAAEDNGNIIIDVGGVGYSVLVSSRVAFGLAQGSMVELFIHTNLRENALELFGFQTLWEKKIFHALVSVSGIGPKSAISVLGALEPEVVLSAIVREDRATLTSVSGIGKKTAELIIVELSDKARKLLAERPTRDGASSVLINSEKSPGSPSKKKRAGTSIPPQGASASPTLGVDIADLWNDALAALVNLGYSEGDAFAAIKMASNKAAEIGNAVTLEKLIMASLQLLSRGL